MADGEHDMMSILAELNFLSIEMCIGDNSILSNKLLRDLIKLHKQYKKDHHLITIVRQNNKLKVNLRE